MNSTNPKTGLSLKSKPVRYGLAVLAAFICVCIVLAGALSSNSPVATSTPELSAIDKQMAELALTQTGVALTQTALVPTTTLTPEPPTETPLPTVTFTPAPEPIILTGSGDSVVDVAKWDGVALMKATYNGGGNFVVYNYDNAGNQIDLLINTIGAYSGTQMIDIFDDDDTTRLAVTASGPWEIQILPPSSTRRENIPGVIQGVGDDVIILSGDASPDLFKADASQGSSNFIVFALTSGGDYDLVFNEIAPYTGTAIAPNSTILIEVHIEGPWSIEVTTK